MSWRVFIAPAAEKVLHKLPQPVERFVLDEFPKLVKENPFIGSQLKGDLSWIRSYHFSQGGQPYRVAYSVNRTESKIVVRYADHRGNFYDKLKRLLGS